MVSIGGHSMPPTKIVVAVNVLDNADILRDYIEWYLSLDVDLILAHDFCSSDGSQDILEWFARKHLVEWSLHPEKSVRNYDPSAQLVRTARDQYNADWVIQCDTDEFLCIEGDSLRTVLDRANNDDLTVIASRCYNMTGPLLEPGESAPKVLTLRIDRGVQETLEHRLSGDLPFPIVFIQTPSKTIVRAAAFTGFGAGSHSATSAGGERGELPQLRFLHYPMRGFDAFQTKVRNAAAWFLENPQLESSPEWGWHWRRWIRLNQEGRLREDYERQFVSPARADELIRDGTCTVDETVANWIKNKISQFDTATGAFGPLLDEQKDASAAAREAVTRLQNRLDAARRGLAEAHATRLEVQTRLVAAEMRLDQTIETMKASVQGLLDHTARLHAAEQERDAARAQADAARAQADAARAQADAVRAQVDAAGVQVDAARAEARAQAQLLRIREAEIALLHANLGRTVENRTRLSAKLAILATENEAFRTRRVVRWVDRLKRGKDLSDWLDPAFQQLKDDTLLFTSSLQGFALRPSENLQTVAFVAYPLGPFRYRLSSVLLAPILTVPLSPGALGIELVVDEQIVARSEVALDQIEERLPTRFDFQPLAPSGDQPAWLRVFVRNAIYPVRVFEWQRQWWPSVRVAERRAFAGFVFATDAGD